MSRDYSPLYTPLYCLGIDQMYFNYRQLLKADYAARLTRSFTQIKLSAVINEIAR